MQEIEKLRSEIDQIHVEITRLFRHRLEVTSQIWEIKKAQSLPLFDEKREDQIIHRFDEALSSPEEKQAVQNFQKFILTETRKYLETKLR